MNSEKINLTNESIQKISAYLQSQGLSIEQINEIIYSDYIAMFNDDSIQNIFGKNDEFQQILQELSNGYDFNELHNRGISYEQLQKFSSKLESLNLTLENALAINQYSNGSNMILSIKRGIPREQIRDEILFALDEKLNQRGITEDNITKMKDFVESLDYGKPLYQIYNLSNDFFETLDLPRSCKPSLNMCIKHMSSLVHIDSTILSLDDALSKVQLPSSMKLYRAVKSNPDFDLKKLSNNQGYTSTSPLYESSFAKYDDYDIVMELYVPKGTQGAYITPFSDYDTAEQEVLLNANDIIYTNIERGFVDQNGKTKNIVRGIVLSKDKSCYRNLGNNQEIIYDEFLEKNCKR